MALYTFRVTIEDQEDFERVIALPSNRNFEELHQAVLESVGFDDSQLASFYLTDENWHEQLEITLLDMSTGNEDEFIPIMNETSLEMLLKEKGQKLIYIYDFVLMWNFRMELTDIQKNYDKSIEYPVLLESKGEAPSQYETESKYPAALTEDDDKLLKGLTFDHERAEHEGNDEDWEDEEDHDDPFSDYEDRYEH